VEQGVPRIIGFAYTDKIAELKMDYRGHCMQTFIDSKTFKTLTEFDRMCIAFDMLRQIIWPLSKIHQVGFVHGDIKPENICMRPWPENKRPIQEYCDGAYQSEYEFTLIDFGIISRFKLKKALKTNRSHIGNLMFSSIRGLKCQQTRYQDDIEALVYLAYYLVWGDLPWDTDYNKVQGVHNMSADKQIALYKRFRQENAVIYNAAIIEKYHAMKPKLENDGGLNPWFCILSHIQQLNQNQVLIINQFAKRQFA
jgi:serine/threonine protein kinase